MRIEQLVPAEAGWKAVFKEPDGGESLSRVLCWASLAGGAESELVGMIVDPADPARIVAASVAASPGGGAFARYRYIAPEPTITVAPAPAPAPPATQDTAEKLAKSFLKRGR
jgi:hypothetical protein